MSQLNTDCACVTRWPWLSAALLITAPAELLRGCWSWHWQELSLLKVQKPLAGDMLLHPFVSLVVPPSLGLGSRTFLSSTGFLTLQRSSQENWTKFPALYLWKSTTRPGSLLFCVSGLQKCSCFQMGWDGLSHPPAHNMEFFSLLCLHEEETEMLLGWLFPLLNSHCVSSPISLVKDEGIHGLGEDCTSL